MKRRCFRLLSLALALALSLAALSGCGGQQAAPLTGTADNDILTFHSNADNRPIIRIGTLYYTPDTSFPDALQAAFPDYLFVLDQRLSAGVNADGQVFSRIEKGEYYDMLITGGLQSILEPGKAPPLVDLSAEGFLNNYLLSALNGVSIDGHIYCVPGTSTLSGIAFNVDMFEEHGWELPQTHDEFFALCETIRAAGIAPFSTNFKYASQLTRLLTMMCYSELFETPEGTKWLAGLSTASSRFEGYMEPMYELVERFGKGGIITADDFTASLTKQRQAFWAGEYAMIDYNSTIYTYAEEEDAPFALGIMPYPAKEAEHAGFAVTPEYYLSLPNYLADDPERLALMKEVLAFISTAEGQEAMLADSLRISNVKNIDLSSNPAAEYAQEAYSKGNLYPIIAFTSSIGYYTLFQETVLSVIEGGSVEAALAHMDRAVAEGYAAGPAESERKQYETAARAEQAFSTLETSYYIADKLRQASGADIALMINSGFFRSNLAAFAAGDISSDMSNFVMKGVGAEDWLTTYSLTGAQLRALIEHPIINGTETDALIAASGLAIEYAPWNARGSRVLKLTLEDGTALADDGLYTVAAWAGVIDERYITETLQVHDALGPITDILLDGLKRDATIKPDIAGRVKLVWPEPEK